jgi:Tfp pilus assembly protein PilE
MNASLAKPGFTIIETVVYLALFAILMGGAGTAAYSILESEGRNQTKAMMQEEGDFLIAKINWAVSGTSAITAPAIGNTGPALGTTKYDSAIGTVSIDLAGAVMELARGANPAQPLSNTNVTVSTLAFTHFYSGGTNPEGVSASFTLSAKAVNGMPISETFATTDYLRK